MNKSIRNAARAGLTTAAVAALAAAGASALPPGDTGYGEWGAPVSAETGSHPDLNTNFNDGCPIFSPDGLSLYMATNRPGGEGGNDIWVAERSSTDAGWSAPVNLGEPVNTAVDDFCPTPIRGKRLLFVSRRDDPAGDIYITRRGKDGWETPERLGPNVNSAAQEWSPSYYELDDGTPVLYFSSTRNGTQDIFVSVNWGPAQPVAELNTGADDSRPNVRHDGKEIVFDSNRTGGPPDIWTATRSSPTGQWSEPQPVTAVNSPQGESRASLSWDGSFMLFGSTRPSPEANINSAFADIYVSYRQRGPN
jgi:Tol biopolymer transport system component